VAINTSTAYQLEPSRTTRDDLKIMLVSRHIEGGLGALERASKPGDEPLVGMGPEILTGDTVPTGRRIDGAYYR
jgi:hypothetical protein